jgi:hypothetical protein
MASGALAGLTCLGAPAWAQYVTGRAAVSLAGTYTETVTDAPYPTALTQRGPSISLTPSLFLIVETPRTNNVVDYAFALTVPFASNYTALTYANRLNFSNRTELDPRTTLMLLLGFSAAPANALNTAQSPTDTSVDTIPTGLSYLLTLNAQESVAHELSPEMTFTQSLGGSYAVPIDPQLVRPTTMTFRPSLALSRTFGLNTLSLSAAAAYTRFGVSEGQTGEVVAGQSSLSNTLALTWLRPITQAFSVSLTLGATQNLNFDGPIVQQQTQPTGAAALTYAFLYAEAVLSYAHQATVNVANATTNFSDMVNLRLAAPLGTSGFSTSLNAGFNHAVPTDGVTLPSNTYLGDVGLNYTPRRVPNLTAGLRGQVTRQTPVGDPTSSFTRYALSLSLTFTYPDPTAAAVQRPSFAPLFSAVPMTVGDPRLGEPPGGPPEPEPPPKAR